MRQNVLIALWTNRVCFGNRLAANGVVRRVPCCAGGCSLHHAAWDGAVNVTSHHPHQRVLLIQAIGVAVTSLDFFTHQPVRQKRAVGLKPTLALGVHHGAHRHVEFGYKVLRLMTNATCMIGQLRRHTRPKLLRNARCGPLLHAPTVTASKHGAQVRSVEIEKRNERHFLSIELVGKVRRWVERCQYVIYSGALVADEIVPAS